jgi:O-antigen ligase
MINILLFLYGIFLGLPDVAIDVYATRLRLDDIVIGFTLFYVLAGRNWRPYNQHQKNVLRFIGLFAAYCVLSSLITFYLGLPFDSYSSFRLLGCMVVLVTLPQTLKTPKARRTLAWALLLGGCIVLVQIAYRWNQIVGTMVLMSHSYQLKSSLSFETWNANTVSIYVILLAFAMLLMTCETSSTERRIFLLASGVFSVVPLFTFCRGATVSIGMAWLVFILLAYRVWSVKLAIIMLFVGMILYLFTYYDHLLISAVQINLATGEGFGKRYEYWATALNLIEKSPLVGHGFGQEPHAFYTMIRGGGTSHNTFLSVFVECGLLGFLLFIWPLGYIGRHFYRRIRKDRNDMQAVICLAFLSGIFVLSLSYSALYWYKYQIIMLALLIAHLKAARIHSISGTSLLVK